jgi:hypothetical protein
MNVVMIEILHGIDRLVTDRKHKDHNTIRKTLLKDKIVTSRIYIYKQTQQL